jgi:excisionase family DNA binding protein
MGSILLSRKQAALVLGISLRMLDKLCRMRRIRYIQLGRRVLFSRSELEQFAIRTQYVRTDLAAEEVGKLVN